MVPCGSLVRGSRAKSPLCNLNVAGDFPPLARFLRFPLPVALVSTIAQLKQHI